MNVQPCLRSGFCCRQGPCGFGEVTSPQDPACRFLEVVETLPTGGVVHACGKYEEIQGKPFAEFSPAFGAGCSSSLFNENRTLIQIHRRLRDS